MCALLIIAFNLKISPTFQHFYCYRSQALHAFNIPSLSFGNFSESTLSNVFNYVDKFPTHFPILWCCAGFNIVTVLVKGLLSLLKWGTNFGWWWCKNETSSANIAFSVAFTYAAVTWRGALWPCNSILDYKITPISNIRTRYLRYRMVETKYICEGCGKALRRLS